MTVAIRAATTADTGAVADIFFVIEKHYWGDKAVGRDAMTRHVESKVMAPDSGIEVILAERGGKALGLATFAILYPGPGTAGTLYMKDLFTLSVARGSGVGKALIAYLAREAIERGCTRFDWTAESTNPGALAYYDRLGVPRVESKVYYRLDGEALTAMASTFAKP